MKHVAKLVIIDAEGMYLMLQRNNHPNFGDDPDLPGGTLENDESPEHTVIREVFEETGIHIDASQVEHIYTGSIYSKRGTVYSLYTANLATRPIVTISWEHASFAWLEYAAFLSRIQHANDPYMQMVYATLAKS